MRPLVKSCYLTRFLRWLTTRRAEALGYPYEAQHPEGTRWAGAGRAGAFVSIARPFMVCAQVIPMLQSR
jgi:hypothetical protein